METVFFDIDTQVDFLTPAGALYVPGSREIAPNIRRLLEYASRRRFATISCADAHTPDDPEFRTYPPHCVAGTPGQRRYFPDLPHLPRHIWLADATVSESDMLIEAGHHYVAEKRTYRGFTNPWLAALRAHGIFHGRDCVAFGVATDVCVRADVLDLCHAGARVRLVRDGIAGIVPADSERALREMAAAGARLVTTDEIVSA